MGRGRVGGAAGFSSPEGGWPGLGGQERWARVARVGGAVEGERVLLNRSV